MPKLGKVVVVGRRITALPGWRKHQRTCVGCNSTGMRAAAAGVAQVTICSGCNGRGYVVEWRKER